MAEPLVTPVSDWPFFKYGNSLPSCTNEVFPVFVSFVWNEWIKEIHELSLIYSITKPFYSAWLQGATSELQYCVFLIIHSAWMTTPLFPVECYSSTSLLLAQTFTTTNNREFGCYNKVAVTSTSLSYDLFKRSVLNISSCLPSKLSICFLLMSLHFKEQVGVRQYRYRSLRSR